MMEYDQTDQSLFLVLLRQKRLISSARNLELSVQLISPLVSIRIKLLRRQRWALVSCIFSDFFRAYSKCSTFILPFFFSSNLENNYCRCTSRLLTRELSLPVASSLTLQSMMCLWMWGQGICLYPQRSVRSLVISASSTTVSSSVFLSSLYFLLISSNTVLTSEMLVRPVSSSSLALNFCSISSWMSWDSSFIRARMLPKTSSSQSMASLASASFFDSSPSTSSPTASEQSCLSTMPDSCGSTLLSSSFSSRGLSLTPTFLSRSRNSGCVMTPIFSLSTAWKCLLSCASTLFRSR